MAERPHPQLDAANPLPPHPDKVPLQIDMFTGERVDTRTRAQKRRDRERYQLKQLPMFDSSTEVELMRTQWKPLTMTTRSGKPLELSLMMEDPRTGEEIEAERMRAAEEQTYPMLAGTGHQPEEVSRPLDVTPQSPRQEFVSVYAQYDEIKRQFPQAIVFFQVGDFYETFNEDAEIAARELDLVLTSRRLGEDARIHMAGVPHHSAEGYITRLTGKGYHVAVCEQVEAEVDEQASVSTGEAMTFPSGVKLDLVRPDDQPQMMAVKLFGDLLLPIWSSRDEALEVLEGHWGDYRAYARGEAQIEIHDQSSTGCFLITYSDMEMLEDVEWVEMR
jgi:hypothetical protein